MFEKPVNAGIIIIIIIIIIIFIFITSDVS
jgi:hypothetical protein